MASARAGPGRQFFANALWQVILLYGVVMTLGANCLGLVVFVPILSRRFVRNRGMAVAVVQSANGFARAVSAPLSQVLIRASAGAEPIWRRAASWRQRFCRSPRCSGRRTRERIGERRAGAPSSAPAGRCAARCTRRISGCCSLVYVFTGLGSFLVALHQLAFAVTIGFDKLYAAEVLGLGAFLSLPGVIITGMLSDYVGRELSAVVTYGTSIFGVACAMLITSPDQHLLLWLHSCFFGLTWGARGPAITAKTADLFPGPQLGTILGVITIGTGIGSASGSWLAGWSFDRHRQLSGGIRAFDLLLRMRQCGLLGTAPSAPASGRRPLKLPVYFFWHHVPGMAGTVGYRGSDGFAGCACSLRC